jgi:putative membrane protein
MKKIVYLGTLMLAMCVSGAFAQSTMGTGSGGNMNMSGKKNADAKFMMMAAMSDMNEIGLSNVALQKSQNEEVKRMAQMIIDDHTKASEELKSLAMSKGVTLPADMDSKHKMMMDKLSAMSGADFDKMYIKAMVKDHEKAVKLFQKESMNGKDADAKAFAAKQLPVLQGHLTMAQSMMNGMMKGGNMSGGKMSGM